MILTTTADVPGYEIGEILGVVSGNTVRTKNLGKDIMAGLKSLVGGELEEYTTMLTDARAEAYNRMVNAARDLGADAVVNIRFTTSQTMSTAAELLAYGTAVRLVPKK
ncbi:YbjQ family protein [Methanoculleus sp.]|uniref:YbjQ family protein n=1 Tax=Methanoculleus sp. TaxID=90427 RepID=UPI00260B4D01|nr:YbjQ family protein [Methanoculleus sp.]MDI6867794.1 YbjQ family protein [Methanoculleus sp.]